MAKASVEPIHHPPPPREVLADAIGRHAAALENVARVAAAHEAAAETVFRAADALKAAEAQHDEALACEAETLAAQALGEPAGRESPGLGS